MSSLPCPNCKCKYPIYMETTVGMYSWKDNKPISYMEELRCPICGTMVRTEIAVVFYKERKLTIE